MTKLINGIMLDTETLSLKPTALVWEFAVVPFAASFTDAGVFEALVAGDPRNFLLNYSGLNLDKFTVSQETVEWTDEQRGNDELWTSWRANFFDQKFLSGTIGPAHIYAIINGMIDDTTQVWCRNAAFDFPIINNLFTATGLTTPWHRSKQCDIYTAIQMANNVGEFVMPEREEASWHRASEDALAQIDQLRAAFSIIYK